MDKNSVVKMILNYIWLKNRGISVYKHLCLFKLSDNCCGLKIAGVDDLIEPSVDLGTISDCHHVIFRRPVDNEDALVIGLSPTLIQQVALDTISAGRKAYFLGRASGKPNANK